MRRFTPRIALAAVLLVAALGAGTAPIFLRPAAIDSVKLLPAPVAENSAEAKAEIDLLLALQTSRTPAEIARVKSEAGLKFTAFESVFGKWFTAENLPQTDAFFKTVDAEIKIFTRPAKDHFRRRRPALVDKRIKPLFDVGNDPSYPSGHATRGMVFALVLADAFPEKREALLTRGLEIGWDRCIAGVHYPSDVVAGRVLGQAVAQALLESPAFKKELDKAKAEIEAAEKAHPADGEK